MRWALAIGVVCGCAADPPAVFEEDFECGAGLCGWKTDGPGVEIVETLQPGEHAIHLPGPGRVSYRVAPPLVLRCAEARLVTDCHWGDDAGTWRELVAVVEGGAAVLRLSPQDYDLDFIPQVAPIAPAAAITDVVVEDVRGDCRVDAIRITDGC